MFFCLAFVVIAVFVSGGCMDIDIEQVLNDLIYMYDHAGEPEASNDVI